MTLDLAMDSNMAPKVQSIKEKLYKLGFIKSKTSVHQRTLSRKGTNNLQN